MAYCSYSDVESIYEDWSTLVGTTGTAIIDSASDWVKAQLLDFYGSVFYESGTTYPFWIKHATALRATYMGLDRRHRQAQEAASGWWSSYNDEAVGILKGLREGEHAITSQQTASWERGIGPCVGVANGTLQSAPGFGLAFSNYDIQDAWFTGDHPVTILIELDGTGSVISQQTYKWQYKYGSVWEETGVPLDWDWTHIVDGLYIRFEDRGTFGTSMRWEIECAPNQGRASKSDGIQSWQMDKSF